MNKVENKAKLSRDEKEKLQWQAKDKNLKKIPLETRYRLAYKIGFKNNNQLLMVTLNEVIAKKRSEWISTPLRSRVSVSFN